MMTSANRRSKRSGLLRLGSEFRGSLLTAFSFGVELGSYSGTSRGLDESPYSAQGTRTFIPLGNCSALFR